MALVHCTVRAIENEKSNLVVRLTEYQRMLNNPRFEPKHHEIAEQCLVLQELIDILNGGA